MTECCSGTEKRKVVRSLAKKVAIYELEDIFCGMVPIAMTVRSEATDFYASLNNNNCYRR